MNDERVRSISAPLLAIFSPPALGLGFAFALTRVLAAQLYDVETFDPVTFGFNPAALWAAAVLERLVPAGRATRLDPATDRCENTHR